MGFIAAEVVEPLDYDFTTLKPLPEGLENAKGTVPEPSSKRAESFSNRFHRLLQLVNEATDTTPTKSDSDEPDSPMSMLDALNKWSEETVQFDEMSPDMKKAEQVYIDLLDYICQGSPTRDEIVAMPSRIRSAFLSWLVEELLAPKDRPNATNRYLAAVPSA